MGSGTAAITAIKSLATSTGVDMDFLKTVGTYLTSMVEIDEALDAFKAHIQMLQYKMSAKPMVEWLLALEKATKKSLEKPAHKVAAQSAQNMRGRPTYASVVEPPATKAAVQIRVEGADKMQLAELLNKAK